VCAALGGGLAGLPGLAAPSASGTTMNLPLHFAPGPGGGFVARGLGYGVSIEPGAVTVRLAAKGGPETITERLLGASATATASAERRLPGVHNVLVGNDPSAWRTKLPTYSRVRVQSAYPGVDVIYYGSGRRIQADYVVAPGADSKRIRLAFEGVTGASIQPGGELRLAGRNGSLTKSRPVAYQMVGARKVPVPAAYRLASAAGGPVAGFEVGAYDRSRPLVIDPYISLDWEGFLGGTGEDFIQGIATESDGYVYVIGATASTASFPTTVGAYDRTYNSGFYDVFVAKYRSNGAVVEYSTLIGGSGTDQPSAIVASGGVVTICGDTDSTNWPIKLPCFQTSNGGGTDGFVTTLNSTGSALVASTYVGGSSYDSPRALKLQGGDVYITGYTQSTNYPTAAPYQGTLGTASASAFLTKLTGSLNAVVYSTYLRGSGTAPFVSRSAQGFALSVDSSGRATVAGRTNHTDFPTTAGAFQTAAGGGYDGFVTKFDATGSALVYSTLFGGDGHDAVRGIAADASGNVALVGLTESTNLPVTGSAVQPTFGGGITDAMVAKLAASGASVLWCTYLGGSSDELGEAIGLDNAGNVFVSGETYSADFPVAGPAVRGTRSGSTDAFVSKFTPSGRVLTYSTYLGASGRDSAVTLANNTGGETLYIGGYSTSGTFSIGEPVWTVQGAYGGGLSDALIARLSPPNQTPTVGATNRVSKRNVSVALTAYLWYASVGVAGKSLDFSLSGTALGSDVTDATGRADYSYAVPAGATLGDYTYTAEFLGDTSYGEAGGSATLSIVDRPTSIFSVDRTATYAGPAYLKAWLRDYLLAWFPGKTVTFKIDGTAVGAGVTGADGQAQYTYTVTVNAGTHAIAAEFAGDATNNSSTCSAVLTVNGRATTVFVSTRTANTGGSSELKALLRTTPALVPLAGKTITFKVSGTTVGTGTTDGTGWAAYTYSVGATPPGSYPVTAEFAAEATYAGSTGTGTLTVQLSPTYMYTINRTVAFNGVTYLRGYLRDAALAWMVGKTISFKIDGTDVGTAVTDASGCGSYLYTATVAVGPHTINAAYAGDVSNAASAASASLTVTP
jgi:hypothetical protein